MSDYIDNGEAGSLKDGQEELFDLDPESEEFDEIVKAYRREQLQWLVDRGMCSWSEAVEFFAGRLVPPSEYARVTRDFVPARAGARFSVCRPDEYPLPEIWSTGHGPNVSKGLAVIHAGELHYLVRVGHPRGYQFHFPGAVACEVGVWRTPIDRLLEPLKTMRVPVVPAEDELVLILDGATHGFEVSLGNTRFSYEWHTAAPKGWEPIAAWLHQTSAELERILHGASS